MNLEELKAANEAPDWMGEEGLKTLMGGYMLSDETPRQMYWRVAHAAGSYYENWQYWQDKFFDAMWKNWLCPASPVLSNMGTDRGLPISCNSIHVGDSVDSIFNKSHELAMLSKNGAGVGIYLGDIRGRGANIKGNGKSEGVIPWAKVFDATTVSVSQGCYDKDTELLTELGWLKFEELKNKPTLKVAQSSSKGKISFVNFTDYIECETSEDLYRIGGTSSAIDLLVTGNHRMAVERRKRASNRRDSNGKFLNNEKILNGYLDIVLAEKLNLHRDNLFWVASKTCGGELEKLTEEDRFRIAYQADGSTNPIGNSIGSISNSIIYNFHFKKERKIFRLSEIVSRLGWKFTINQQKDGSFHMLVRVPITFKISKNLNDVFEIHKFSKGYAEEFVKEISYWDGHITENDSVSYSCIVRENVDFVQAASFIAGRMSSMSIYENREGNRKNLYSIFICNRNTVDGESLILSKEYYEGKVFCVTVREGLLVVRRNGKVSICGNSTRRGASAVYLPVRHADIEEYLNMRRPTGDVNRRCLNLNHGICIDDEWMNEAKSGDKEKRRLWQEILKTRVETGEPYLFFSDNVNKQNPECYKTNNLRVSTSNICSEIFLYTDPDHSFVCCLSSLNLVKWEEWKDSDLPQIATRFLDAVLQEYITKSEGVPGLESSRRSAIKGRAIGIGVLGWHTYLQNQSIPFDSFQAMTQNNFVFKTIREKAESETKILAQELGEPEWCRGFGRRNTHLIAVAPTVSNSTISGGHSAGIEPIAANIFSQKSAKGTFIRKNNTLEKVLETMSKNTTEVWKSINEQNGSVQHLDILSKEQKEVFLTAREINQHAIIKQAAQRQKWIDQGQSVNLFFANNASPKYIHEVHLEAWELGLKSLYYLRTEGVLKGDLASRSKEECAACEA